MARRPRQPEELLHLLTRAERLSVERIRSVLDEFGCTAEAWRVLDLLSDGAGHNMTAVAEHAFLPAPTLTKLVDQLVDDNLVFRRIDPADRRRVLAQLTPRGLERWQQVSRAVRARWAEAEPLAPEDEDALRTLLARLGDAWEGTPAEGITRAAAARVVGRGR
ncbi:MarR family winged helix-turn-helix transcriptional regulator [Streptomyces althioticus]|uniref:MarR family winged helix-turn-helix transcriptional regulator n=1 Tax=Streptomyces althioticus TaxID=83380 RepID=UPI0033FA7394